MAVGVKGWEIARRFSSVSNSVLTSRNVSSAWGRRGGHWRGLSYLRVMPPGTRESHPNSTFL